MKKIIVMLNVVLAMGLFSGSVYAGEKSIDELYESVIIKLEKLEVKRGNMSFIRIGLLQVEMKLSKIEYSWLPKMKKNVKNPKALLILNVERISFGNMQKKLEMMDARLDISDKNLLTEELLKELNALWIELDNDIGGLQVTYLKNS